MLLFLQQRQGATLAPTSIPEQEALSEDSIPGSMPSLTPATAMIAPPHPAEIQGFYQDLHLLLQQMIPQEIIQFDMDSASTASNSALHSDVNEHPYDSISSDPGQFLSDSDTHSSGSYNSEIDAV